MALKERKKAFPFVSKECLVQSVAGRKINILHSLLNGWKGKLEDGDFKKTQNPLICYLVSLGMQLETWQKKVGSTHSQKHSHLPMGLWRTLVQSSLSQTSYLENILHPLTFPMF